MMPGVEVVIINYKRPANVVAIVEAFRLGTTPCVLTICDVHPDRTFALPKETLAQADKVFTWRKNYGSFNRFIPAFGVETDYVYFHDDDMLPGRNALNNLLTCAASLRRFGVIGQMGRNFPNWRVTWKGVPRSSDGPVEVDHIVRGYFVRTKNLPHFLAFAQRHRAKRFQGHDDLLLSLSMRKRGLKCFLSPDDGLEESRIRKRELPSPFALAKRPEHRRERNRILRWFKARL